MRLRGFVFSVLSAMLWIPATHAQQAGPTPRMPTRSAPDAVVAKVGELPIRESDIADYRTLYPSDFGRLSEGERRKFTLMMLIDMKLMEKEADRLGETDEAFRRLVDLRRGFAAREALLGETIADKITDADLKARYKSYLETTPAVLELETSQIISKTEADALKVIRRLDAGEDFRTVESELSIDPDPYNLGHIGWISKGSMGIAELWSEAASLEPGQHSSKPFTYINNWYVLRVAAKRDHKPFKDIEEKLRNAEYAERYQAAVLALRATAAVTVMEPTLAPALADAYRKQR